MVEDAGWGVVPLVYKASASGRRLMSWPSPSPKKVPDARGWICP